MVLKNLRATISDVRLRLPIGNREYIIDTLTAENWLWLQAVYFKEGILTSVIPEPSEDAIPEEHPTEIDLQKRVLGKAYAQMITDGVKVDEMRVAGMTATIDAMHGREAAIAYWESGGVLGNSSAPMTEDQIRGLLETAQESLQPHTDRPAGPSTRSRTSRSGATATKSPTSRGRKSSNTGT